MTSTSLAQSYKACERIARTQAANFYPAFRVLPKVQRQAMCALYAFLRITDDLVDLDHGSTPIIAEDGHGLTRINADGKDGSNAKNALDDWHRRLELALEGKYSHAIHPAP